MAAILLVNAGLLVTVALALWWLSVRIGDVSFVDAFWPLGMVLLTVLTCLQAEGSPARMFWITLLVAVWGLRLGGHLYLRWRRQGEDLRYAKLIGRTMAARRWSFARTALVQVFAVQTALLFIVCLPAQIGQIPFQPSHTGMLAFLGKCLALLGIAFEAVSDWQLMRFREHPGSRNKVLDTGLWRYTRHPNYFGDVCFWWGIWLIAAESTAGLFSLVGPIVLTVLLTRVSGVPMLERGLTKTRPGYADYVRRTPTFFPWWPKP